MRIGFVISSGGGVFKSAYQILHTYYGSRLSLSVVTDRESEVREFCSKNGITNTFIKHISNSQFSESAYEFFSEQKCDIVFLFYTRLVTSSLFAKIPTFNIHPSLLPAYKGFGALEALINDKGNYLGCTIHLVDSTTDGGPIVAQSAIPIAASDRNIIRLSHLSYGQKLYLTLVVIEAFGSGKLLISEGKDGFNFEYTEDLPYSYWGNPSCINKQVQYLFEHAFTNKVAH